MTQRGLVGVMVLGFFSSCATGSGAISRTAYEFEPIPASATGWIEIETPDFVLHTDQAPELAEHAAQLLAQSLTGLKAMFGRAPAVRPLKLSVYAMKDDLEFERRFGKLTWGFASSNGEASTIVLYGPPERWFVRSELSYEANQSVLVHELAHAILHQYFGQQPQWFAEGLAQYLETFGWIDADTVRFGDPNLVAYRRYRAIRSLTLSDMARWKTYAQRETEVLGMYGLSWAFVHFALNKHGRDFGSYMDLLARQGPDEAWAQTFARLPDLDQALFGYMKVGEYQVRVVKVPPAAPVRAAVRAMTSEEQATMRTLFEVLERGMHKQNGS